MKALKMQHKQTWKQIETMAVENDAEICPSRQSLKCTCKQNVIVDALSCIPVKLQPECKTTEKELLKSFFFFFFFVSTDLFTKKKKCLCL